ncbi:MAG: ATP-binding protein [Candidatus Omnitrophota bacterium]
MYKKMQVSSNFKDIKQAATAIAGLFKEAKADEADIFDIRLSLEEALINAAKYGNKLDEKRNVYIEIDIAGNKATISVEDEGDGFDHESLPDPTKEENLLKASGRGVFLIKHLMDKVEYNKKGNRVTITKYLKKSQTRQQIAE